MSDENSDLFGITQFFCHLIRINWFNISMLRNNNCVKQTSTIVKRYKNLNSYLLITMKQDHSSIDSRYGNSNHCCLFTMILSGFNGKYEQIMKINERFNVKIIATLLHFIIITIMKHFCVSCICSMVCFIYIYISDSIGYTAFYAHVVVLGGQAYNSTNKNNNQNTKQQKNTTNITNNKT